MRPSKHAHSSENAGKPQGSRRSDYFKTNQKVLEPAGLLQRISLEREPQQLLHGMDPTGSSVKPIELKWQVWTPTSAHYRLEALNTLADECISLPRHRVPSESAIPFIVGVSWAEQVDDVVGHSRDQNISLLRRQLAIVDPIKDATGRRQLEIGDRILIPTARGKRPAQEQMIGLAPIIDDQAGGYTGFDTRPVERMPKDRAESLRGAVVREPMDVFYCEPPAFPSSLVDGCCQSLK
jgi:hypothetical protein